MKLSSLRVLALVGAASIIGCHHDDDVATAGCEAGNRSQCISQLALGDHFGCARMHDRTVWCWGANDESQLGYATTDLCPTAIAGGQTQSVACHTFPFQVLGLDSAAQVAAGQQFACALRTDGTVWCWGSNAAGQLGTGDTRSTMQPIAVSGLATVTAIAVGARHACAVSGGAVWCWGAADALQLGTASPSQICGTDDKVPCETVPRQVPGLTTATAIAAGAAHTCAVNSDGSVMCWGANNFGQLGNGAATDAAIGTPQAVRAGHLTQFAKTIAAGSDHTCTVRDDGAVFCWGRNDHGELGSLPSLPPPDHCAGACSPTPLLVASLPGAPTNWDVQPDAGASAPDMTALPDLSMDPPDLWMPAEDGGINDMSVQPDLAAHPVTVAATPPTAITAGGFHACALLSDATVRCWGSDDEGQLGDGQRLSDPTAPVAVIAQPGAAHDNSLAGVTLIVAGTETSCARLSDGSLRCWGSNVEGALGDGDVAPQGGPVPLAW